MHPKTDPYSPKPKNTAIKIETNRSYSSSFWLSSFIFLLDNAVSGVEALGLITTPKEWWHQELYQYWCHVRRHKKVLKFSRHQICKFQLIIKPHTALVVLVPFIIITSSSATRSSTTSSADPRSNESNVSFPSKCFLPFHVSECWNLTN